MTETVTRLRSSPVANRYGGTDKDWSDPDELAVKDCLIAPRTEAENTTEGREGVVIGWTVYAPPDADIVATDRVRVRGVDHDVDGQPEDWSGGFSSWEPGIAVQLRRVEG